MFIPEMNFGTLYLDNKEIGPVTDISIDPTAGPSDGLVGRLIEAVEVSFTARFDPWDMWLYLTGRKITNNWLKMHGGIMRRRAHLRKGD